MAASRNTEITRVVEFLDQHFAKRQERLAAHRRLLDSIRYSLLQDGGKRFRPVLAQLTAQALGRDPALVVPFAAAVECIHTYSLIHDDLPAMDNDDFRRGQPTNHKVYGEALAILAGDALLTEAFQIIADHYAHEPKTALRLVSELARASGVDGMVGGQAIDLGSKRDALSIEQVRVLHSLKTGALIRVSVVGAAIACGAEPNQLQNLTAFAEALGLAFQVADDLLDHDPAKPEAGSYPALLGVDETSEFLKQLTEQCLQSLSEWSREADPLREIVNFNRDRKV